MGEVAAAGNRQQQGHGHEGDDADRAENAGRVAQGQAEAARQDQTEPESQRQERQ